MSWTKYEKLIFVENRVYFLSQAWFYLKVRKAG